MRGLYGLYWCMEMMLDENSFNCMLHILRMMPWVQDYSDLWEREEDNACLI